MGYCSYLCYAYILADGTYKSMNALILRLFYEVEFKKLDLKFVFIVGGVVWDQLSVAL